MTARLYYLIVKLAALTAIIVNSISANTRTGLLAVFALALCCLFCVDYIVDQAKTHKLIRLLCPALCAAGCITLDAQTCFPLLCALIMQLSDTEGMESNLYRIGLPAIILCALVYSPGAYELTIALMLASVGGCARYAIVRMRHSRALIEEQRQSIADLQQKNNELISYVKTARENAAIEERNRFSSRIHDRLGHGISGSIILLEGARLCMDSDPEKAGQCIETATENLRQSVDSIREALHEERPERSLMGEMQLREALEKFSVSYGIKTSYTSSGDIDRIPPQLWVCISENLTEALTNALKHSKAKHFSLSVNIYNKLLRVQYADDGGGAALLSKGIGLEVMESRTAKAGGRCLFQNGGNGFTIINVFDI